MTMSNTTMHYPTLSPAEVYDLQRGGQVIDLVDVRTGLEFRALHAQDARWVPLGKLTPESVMAGRRGSADQPLYLICQSGGRSRAACDRLAAAGLKVVNVAGGTSAWKRAGLPVVRGAGGAGGLSGAIRLGAVALALVLLVLGVTVQPAFLWPAGGVWVALLIVNRGCPFGACAIDPRRGDAPEGPGPNDSSKGTDHANV
jgi:rhodanese-related sulfurtransferase